MWFWFWCTGRNYLFLVYSSKLTVFCVRGRNWPDFKAEDRNWLWFSSVWIGIDLVWGGRQKSFGSRFGIEIDLFSRGGIEIGLILLLASISTLFQRCVGNYLCFCSGGSEPTPFFVRGVEINFVSVCEPKMTWCWCMDWNWLGFGVGIEVDLFFMCGPRITCF